MSEPLQGTASAALAIDRVKYTHDAMIDLIIAQPGITQNLIARHFGYSVPWVSRIFNSDAFQARLALRKEDLVDPSLLLSIEERLRGVADKSLEIIHERLASMPLDGKFALAAADMATKALGFGARQQNLNLQANFVVALPAKAQSDVAWVSAQSPSNRAGVEVVSDVEVRSPDLARLAGG